MPNKIHEPRSSTSALMIIYFQLPLTLPTTSLLVDHLKVSDPSPKYTRLHNLITNDATFIEYFACTYKHVTA